MDWQLLDWLFAGVLLLGLWALASILGAGAARRARAGASGVCAAGHPGLAHHRRPDPGGVLTAGGVFVVVALSLGLGMALYRA